MSSAWPDDANARDRIATFVDLEFSYMGRHLALSRIPLITTMLASRGEDVAPQWRLIRNGARPHAESMTQLLQQADIMRLRTLLARHEYFVHRLTDLSARNAVARLIERGAMGLFEPVEASIVVLGSTASPPALQAGEALRPVRSPATSFGARVPGVVATLPSVIPPPSAPTTLARGEQLPDPTQALDQNDQARTLVVAARDGIPFCEECARRAARRAGRVAA
jgi:hypothetical protein